ncbi:MAG: helix-turn-helix domain-containing protein [Actinomyces urogenitalis]|uniref:helix-turn-helix domain-containing protein n=2 Tax=Actinomyces urogenitalis TaxID=103621 RepID=UPI003995E2C8
MQHQLGEAMGVSRATVSNYETGFSSKPRKIVLNVWAMATGVPIQWIETGTAPGAGDDGSPGRWGRGFREAPAVGLEPTTVRLCYRRGARDWWDY